MKKFKKGLALTLAMSMVMSSAAFADDTSVSFTDNGGVENDNSVLPTFAHVELPTMTDGAYDFVVDVEGLLNKYDSTNYDGSTVYFNAQKTAAKLELIGDDTGKIKLATLEKAEDTNCTELAKQFTDTNKDEKVDDLTSDFTAKFYVWAPNGSQGAGAYKEITKDNYTTYVEVTSTVAEEATITVTPKTHNVGTADTVFDGKIYKEAYTTLTDMTKAATYVTYASDAITAVDGLYYTTDSTDPSVSYNKLVVLSGEQIAGTGEVEAKSVINYVKEVRTNTKTSDKAKIINKAYNPVAVKVAVEVKNVSDDYMAFVASNTFGTTPTKAELYMAITDDAASASTKAVDATSKKAEMYYVIGGIDETTLNQYQLSTPTVDTTGSHTYVNYEAATTNPKSVEFAITAAANTNDKDVWAEYVEALEDADSGVVRPEINVVFSFENVEEESVTVDTTTTYKYVGTTNSYVVGGGTITGADGVATATANYVATGLKFTSGDTTNGAVLTFVPGSANKVLATNYFSVNGVEVSGYKSYSSYVQYSENQITITSACFANANVIAATTGNSYVIVVKDTEGTTYTVTATIAAAETGN